VASASLYKAVWRWHFYAGVFCIPSLLLLSATGGIYLFDNEIEAALYRDLYHVAPSTSAPLDHAALRDKLVLEKDETLLNYFPPSAPDRSASYSVLIGNRIRSVFLNPYTGATLGSIDFRIMDTVKQLHNFQIAGVIGNRIVECVAGWAIILFITGLYLWWPKSIREAVHIRGNPRQRTFWRDIHRVTGAIAGLVICFQAFSGLSWSGVWGAILRSAVEAAGHGIPPMVDDDRPQSKLPPDFEARAPWTLQGLPTPESKDAANKLDIGLDKIISLAQANGMPPGFGVSIPSSPKSIYTVMFFGPDDPTLQRSIHFDRYTGKILGDIRFSDYGAASRYIEIANAIHMGNYFGAANQLILLAVCVAVWLLAASGIVMWWKRRPKEGGLTSPPYPERREARTIFFLTILISLLFPVTALSLIVLVAIDRFTLAGWGRLRRSADA
jgi:uncharacterized iron-regulated membrane protein